MLTNGMILYQLFQVIDARSPYTTLLILDPRPHSRIDDVTA